MNRIYDTIKFENQCELEQLGVTFLNSFRLLPFKYFIKYFNYVTRTREAEGQPFG